MEKITIQLTVNGELSTIITSPNRTLLEVLREDLCLTGVKESCSQGACGSCTVLIDGFPARSCLILAPEAQGKSITTIEGLSKNGRLHPVQEAFVNHHAIQCGFCSPGMILTGVSLLEKNPHPSETEIVAAISGNVCRCTGYTKIVEALKNLSHEER